MTLHALPKKSAGISAKKKKIVVPSEKYLLTFFFHCK